MSQKVCAICSADVSGRKRVKDRRGNYFCERCWEFGAARKTADGPGVTAPPSQPATGWTVCADHDRNVSVAYPLTWHLADPKEVPEAMGALMIAAPSGTGRQEALVFVELIRVPPGMTLDEVGDRHTHVQQSNRNFIQLNRVSGRHASGMLAVSLGFEFEYGGSRVSKELLLLRAAMDVVLEVTASCDPADKSFYRETFKQIVRSVRVTDPQRPVGMGSGPAPIPLRVMAPAGSPQMQWMWTLFDTTSRMLTHSLDRLAREQFGIHLGRAAAFEIWAYVFVELTASMLSANYRRTRPVSDFFFRALVGEPFSERPSSGLPELLLERILLYSEVGWGGMSPRSVAAFAEVLRTSGRDDAPRQISAKPFLAGIQRMEDWHDAVGTVYLSVCEIFLYTVTVLFRRSPDVETLSTAAMEETLRAAAGQRAARAW